MEVQEKCPSIGTTTQDSSTPFKRHSGQYKLKKTELQGLVLASKLIHANRMKEAEDILLRLLGNNNKLVPAWLDLGVLYQATGRYGEHIRILNKAIEADPDDPTPRVYRALSFMRQGKLKEGFLEYQYRFLRAVTSTLYGVFSIPYWNGEDLTGRHVLVWTEQGIGDEIMLAGLLGDLLERRSKITVLCSGRVLPTLARSFPTIDFLPKPEDKDYSKFKFKEIDFQA